jgi:hypothetical protein
MKIWKLWDNLKTKQKQKQNRQNLQKKKTQSKEGSLGYGKS